MSVRNLNWLKFGGLVGLAFVLGLFFAGLLDLPETSLAQGGTGRLASTQPAILPVQATPLPAARPLAELSDAFAAVAEHVRPSVAYITSERKQRVAGNPRIPQGFEPFFGFPQQRGRPPAIERGSGSGFVVSADGYILTNNHVVDGADKVTVQLLDHRTFSAIVVGTDPTTDVAVIKIDAKGLTPAALGSSAATRIGEWVLAVGNPLGENLTFTVTSGIVSAKGRGSLNLPGRSERSIQDFIQTDAAINPGNSGGPLVNVRGEVVGINSAIASETGYNMGYGFAIPIDLAKQVMEQLVKNGKVVRAALGVLVGDAGPLDAKAVGLPDIRGVVVRGFSSDEDSPAKRAGLELLDVIVSIDGQPVEYTAQLQQIVGFKRVGEAVKVEVARKGGVRKTYTVRTIPTDAPTDRVARADATDNNNPNAGPEQPAGTAIKPLGVTVSPLTAQLIREFEIPGNIRGVIIQSVDDEGPARNQLYGVDTGTPDIILVAEGSTIQNEADLRAAVRSAGSTGILSLIVWNRAANNQQGGRRALRIDLGN